ncbi:MAG: C4-dicarboxylate transporter, DctQ subunit [Thermococcaceae archaeon]|jgi:TRAP-type C4-dicarboxylate transport system permease small subunit|nr:C4-dicarboxylate transporter, DctQ subunit [Thermococcaceae archaeon]
MGKKLWSNLEELISSVMIAIMVTVAFVNVITRYFIKISLAWTEELEVNLFVWLVLLGTAMAFKKGGHLGMGFIYEKFPPKYRKSLFAMSVALGVAFFSVLAYLGYLEVRDEIDLGVTTESLGIPVYIYTIATPVLSVLVIVRMLQAAVRRIRAGEY